MGAVTNHLMSFSKECETGDVFTDIFAAKWKFCCKLLSRLKQNKMMFSFLYISCRGQEGFGRGSLVGAERYRGGSFARCQLSFGHCYYSDIGPDVASDSESTLGICNGKSNTGKLARK